MIGKRFVFVLIALMLCVSVCAAFAGTPATPRKDLPISLKPVSAQKNSLSISVDPRIELLSIVQYLSDYKEIANPALVTRLNHTYRKDVNNWFSKYKSHPVMEMFNQMAKNGFAYDAPPHAVLYQNTDLTLNNVIYKDDPMDVHRAGGKEQMVAFAKALRSFAVESGFPEFYKSHIPFYEQITGETIKNVKDENVIEQLEQYTGEKKASYTVVISPLLGGGSFGPQVERKKGCKEVYCIMGSWQEKDGIPQFGSTEYFHNLQWHEFGHSFTNPLANKYQSLWEKHSDLFRPMEEKMKSQAYGQWSTVVYESVLRAMTTRLAYRCDGKDAGDRELRGHTGNGFVFTKALANKLEQYEANRTKYPTLDSFFPELLKVFDGFSQASVKDAVGGGDLILNDMYKSAGILVYDLPDNASRDDAVSYVKKVHDRFFGSLEMIDATKLDEATLKEKLKGDFILYTTIGSRLFNAATQPLNIQINDGILNWNGVNEPVSGLRIILIGKNPYGDGKCEIYAGGSNSSLVGINGCFHGPCSYHIFKGDKLLKEGHYNAKFEMSNP
ncbi:MAG: DUF4932 domain-containing protein [Armatimonadota bacterium]